MAALRAQASRRDFDKRKEGLRNAALVTQAAIRIQSLRRGSTARKAVKETKAAHVIQRHIRGSITRAHGVAAAGMEMGKGLAQGVATASRDAASAGVTRGAAAISSSAAYALNKTRSLFSAMHYWGEPIHASVRSSLKAGSPPGANLYEHLRDHVLNFMMALRPVVTICCIVGMLGVLVAGVLLLTLLIAMEAGLDLGTITDPATTACNASIYNQTDVLFEGDHKYPPRVVGGGIHFGQRDYVALYCTNAQYAFNLCIKYFAMYFTFINALPLPWTISIFINALCPRKKWGLGPDSVGVDFYGRPCESLWFHLPRTSRRNIAFFLLFAAATQLLAFIFHLAWWSYLAGQTWPGALLQNVWIVLQIFAQAAAGHLQGKAEKAVREAQPGRFPPTLGDYVKGAYKVWRETWQARGERPRVCCGEHSFVRHLMVEIRAFREDQKKQHEGHKVDPLTGIVIHASRRYEEPDPSGQASASSDASYEVNTVSATALGTNALPAGGWTEHEDPATGRAFYANSATGETLWEHPSSRV